MTWHEAKQLTAGAATWSELYPICTVHLLRLLPNAHSATGGSGGPAAAALALDEQMAGLALQAEDSSEEMRASGVGGQFEYAVVVEQSLDDGRHHEDAETPLVTHFLVCFPFWWVAAGA